MEPLQKQFIYGSVILIVNLKVWKSAQSVIASFTQQITAFLVLHAKRASTNSILHVFTNGSQHHTSPLAHCAKLLSKNYNFEQWNVQLVVFWTSSLIDILRTMDECQTMLVHDDPSCLSSICKNCLSICSIHKRICRELNHFLCLFYLL